MGYKYKDCVLKCSEIKKFIENDIIKNKNLNFCGLKFDYTSADLLEFYKIIYNEVLNSDVFLSHRIKNEKVFDFFSPEKIENISFVYNNELNSGEIVLKYKKDVLSDEYERENLNWVKRNAKDPVSIVNCGLRSTAMIKQIVLIYLEFAQNNGIIQAHSADCGYIDAEMNLDCLENISDDMKKELDNISDDMKKKLRFTVKFDGTREDLLKYYGKAYNLYGGTSNIPFIKNVNSEPISPILFVFDPVNVKEIIVQDGGLSVIFKFDIMNIKKRYNNYINGVCDFNYNNVNEIDEIFENFKAKVEDSYFGILAKRIISNYMKIADKLKLENCKQATNEPNKEIVEEKGDKLELNEEEDEKEEKKEVKKEIFKKGNFKKGKNIENEKNNKLEKLDTTFVENGKEKEKGNKKEEEKEENKLEVKKEENKEYEKEDIKNATEKKEKTTEELRLEYYEKKKYGKEDEK